ncbi:cellulase family glycosylhydrolase [Aquabacterium sp.]|uniref:cellulase family glycosylhydrolase n=1 Tax=Aquabacterium sp. TaxID=1872578 RepID=UPI003D6D9160
MTTAVEGTAYLAAVSTAATQQQALGTSLETFDTSGGSLGGSALGWIFELGNEFPGARGGLTLTGGENGMGASMLTDLNCGGTTIQLAVTGGCGKYVAMTRRLGSLYSTATPETAMLAISVQATHPLVSTGLRVVDSTGQSLQYSFVPRTLETSAGATWAKIMVPLGSSTSHWGGVNDGKLYGGITGFSVTASTPVMAAPAASVKVDNVRLLDSGATTYALSRQAALLKDGVLPSTNGRLAVATHFYQTSDGELSHAAQIGISVVRMDLFWKLIEIGGRFDFSNYDAILKRLAKQGQSALFILDYGHPDHGGGSPLNPADRAAFVEFARQATLFAKGRNVVGFEVWNEPDNSNFWTQGDPNTYAQLLTATREVIKTTDSTRKVVNGGPSWVNLPYILRLAKTGELKNLDGFAIHPYRPWGPESFAPEVAQIKAILSSQGVANPSIWVTEWGYSSFGAFDAAVYGNGLDPRARARQAVLVLRKVLTETALNLPMSTLYELSDSGIDGDHNEHNYGLLTKTGEPKPAYTALKTLYSFTKTRNYVGLVKDVPANVHAMRWDGTDDSVFAVWVDSANVPLKLVLPKAATVTSLTGANVTTSATGNSATSQVTVTEAGGPIFIRFPITTTQ